MYHYVRDVSRTPFPEIKAMGVDVFRDQLDWIASVADAAGLAEAIAFLKGEYTPGRDLFLLTFDDGLKEHYQTVTPILAERGIQGLFFLPTASAGEQVALPVHMSHFLMARLGLRGYREQFAAALRADGVETGDPERYAAVAQQAYVLDTPEVAQFKYLVNFLLEESTRDRIVTGLFDRHIGDRRGFAQALYLSWDEARSMQDAGMVLGGHSHRHRPLSGPSSEVSQDLELCRRLLQDRLHPQPLWPFSYPYGKRSSFTPEATRTLQRLGFHCAFTTESGDNGPGCGLFEIARTDCADSALMQTRFVSEEVSH
jgi:peptidoglycan/xylan/chitin deacetylase (PgdA/CDA1 family)